MVTYATYLEFPGWALAPDFMRDVLKREAATSILEVGAGREPTFGVDEVQALGLRYTVNDIDAAELEHVDRAYDTACFDMSGTLPVELGPRRFDLIFSRMVNEHVADGATYYRNIFGLLEPGGLTVHFFATLFTVPSLANRLLPEALSARLKNFSFGRADQGYGEYEKFPARYSWCRGPSSAMRTRFTDIGFEVEDYVGYFGHGYYGRVPPLHKLELAKTRWLLRHPVDALTSYAVVVLRRPGSPA
jgi:SAM-dependent methyltransferase